MRPVAIFLLAFCALSGAPTVWGQPTFTEYPLPTAASNPAAIAKGPDGNLWIVEYAANKIAKMTTTGVITEYPIPTPNSQSAGITAGPDGNLWFCEVLGNKIGKITPDGTITEYPLPTAFSLPASIAAGPDGNIWFIEGTGIGKITTSGALTEYSFGPVLVGYSCITAGPDGNVWFTETLSDKVGRITPSGAITQFPLLAAEPAGATFTPQAITQGPDGNLWVAGSGTVWKITPAGTAVPYPVPQPAIIAAGPDGNLWFTELNNSKIVKLTTGGMFTEYSAPTGGGGFIASGPDGNMWFTEPAGNKIGKLVLSTVPPDNLLTLSQTSLTFSAAVNGTPPAAQTLTVRSPTAAPFTASASSLFSPPWLTISPSGNLTGNQTITVSVNQAYIGTYGAPLFGYVLLTSGNVTQTVLVTLTLTAQVPGGDIKVLPTSLSFNYTTPQGVPPLDQSIYITDVNLLSGSIPLTISSTITTPSGGQWLTLTKGGSPFPNGGSGTSPMSTSAHVDPTGLSPGVYNAAITIIPTGGATVTVPVTLTVIANPNPTTLSLSSTTLSFVWQSGTASPPAQFVQLTESGRQLSFLAQSDAPTWLSVAPVAGDPPATLTVSALPFGLSPGNYTGTITVTVPLLGGVSAKITVSLTVTASLNPTTISLSPTTLNFVWQSGTASPPAQFVQLTESGPALTFQAQSDSWTWLYVTPASSNPPATLTISVNPIGMSPGNYTGTITVTLPALDGASAKITVSLTVTAPAGPVITGVANAASFGVGPVAAGEIVSIFGSGLGPASSFGLMLDSSGKVATSLGGASVSFNGYPAPLTYASATQINCVIPYEVDGVTDVLVQVSYSGQHGALALKSAATMPGIFSSNGSGTGAAAATNSTGGYNGPNNPAAAGSIITLYLTGEGQTNPGGVTGKITTVDTSSGGPLTPQPVAGVPRVSIGGQPATVTFYGEAPGMVSGVLQLNVQIPASLPGGSLQLTVWLGAASSQNGVTVSVQ